MKELILNTSPQTYLCDGGKLVSMENLFLGKRLRFETTSIIGQQSWRVDDHTFKYSNMTMRFETAEVFF